ncbi:MAG: 6-phosphofructokinase [Phycisphaeraceae bacterium]|nr:6-phosphofructokinase [Phycisphaeraceae bacterium]
MASSVRRIGVLTGGGDCPGLNAVIRAATKHALFHGMEVLGIEDGFLGLIENRVRPLGYEDVSNILTLGGTILGSSNKADPKKYPTGVDAKGQTVYSDMSETCLRHIEEHGIDALVVIGGDGTMTCAAPFIERGVRCVGVPKTIDNDLWGTDLTFGHLTAVEVATAALDRVHTTAASHHRAMVVEVMGRNAGWIALSAGIASGSDAILLPEIPFGTENVCEFVRARSTRGKRFSIICCAEGAHPRDRDKIVERVDPSSPDPIRLGGVAKWLAGEIERCTGIESRYVVLGHVQRGGTPTAADRVLSTLFGDAAMRLILEEKFNRLVAWRGGSLTDAPMLESAGRQRVVPHDHAMIQAARCIYTCFGD